MTNAPTPAGMAADPYRLVVGDWKEDPRTIHGPDGYLVGGLEPDDARRLCAELNRLAALAPVAAEGGEKDKLRIAVEALRSARKALYHHYCEWDGEPEDAVPLQTAMADCDEALSALRTEPTGGGEGA